ncbi:MAG: hypothetical protein SFW09_23540 [Hyphomicrobiaceae bacterium]|nr:hypothetical protein [Hyphomicrobiaceae bacterium]
MTAFRAFLVLGWIVLATYTAAVVARHGMGFLPVFFGDMAKVAWAGQFNLDFMLLLALSAVWVAWRHAFSGAGLLLAVMAFFGGAGFLLPYLLVASIQCHGDTRTLLLGPSRAV